MKGWFKKKAHLVSQSLKAEERGKQLFLSRLRDPNFLQEEYNAKRAERMKLCKEVEALEIEALEAAGYCGENKISYPDFYMVQDYCDKSPIGHCMTIHNVSGKTKIGCEVKTCLFCGKKQ